MNVLVAEDSRPVAEAMAYCLRRKGHVVTLAPDGEAVLAALGTASNIQLLVLDLGLPKVDGAEVLRQVRARQPRLPVLVCSAREDAEGQLAQYGLRGDAYVAKPFAVATFERSIAQLGWRFGLAEREAAALRLVDHQRRLLEVLMAGDAGWMHEAQIVDVLRASGLTAAPQEVEHCIEGLQETLSTRTPIRLIRVRGLGYGLVAAD